MIWNTTLVDGMRRCLMIAALIAVASATFAQQLPSYYPSDGFERSGRIDAVMLDAQQVIVNDISYRLADNAVIHALNAYSVPRSRLRAGQTVGFRLAGERQIMEIWLLPDGFESRRGRRR